MVRYVKANWQVLWRHLRCRDRNCDIASPLQREITRTCSDPDAEQHSAYPQCRLQWLQLHRVHDGTGGKGSLSVVTGTDANGEPLWCARPFRRLYKLDLVESSQGTLYMQEGESWSVSLHLPLDDIIAQADGKTLSEEDMDTSEDDEESATPPAKKRVLAIEPIVPAGSPLFQR
ncbi:hypothetical protein BDW74DRAFT_26689 [Aspergillus multicolor]|uniref:uncharacterized protein n=1 Tax=Aspergillus multicolor TaxID=41759 RepID=UPI003CCE5033